MWELNSKSNHYSKSGDVGCQLDDGFRKIPGLIFWRDLVLRAGGRLGLRWIRRSAWAGAYPSPMKGQRISRLSGYDNLRIAFDSI